MKLSLHLTAVLKAWDEMVKQAEILLEKLHQRENSEHMASEVLPVKYYTAPEWSESAAWDWKEQPPMLDAQTALQLHCFLEALIDGLSKLHNPNEQLIGVRAFVLAGKVLNDEHV